MPPTLTDQQWHLAADCINDSGDALLRGITLQLRNLTGYPIAEVPEPTVRFRTADEAMNSLNAMTLHVNAISMLLDEVFRLQIDRDAATKTAQFFVSDLHSVLHARCGLCLFEVTDGGQAQ
jgi:hypothetical protein